MSNWTTINGFEKLLELISSKFGIHSISSRNHSQFKARLRRFSFSKATISDFEATSYKAEITAEALSLPNRPAIYALHISRLNPIFLEQDGRAETLDLGGVALMDTRVRGFIDAPRDMAASLVSVPVSVWDSLAAPPLLKNGYALKAHRLCTRLAHNLALELAQAGQALIEEHRATLIRQIVELVGLALSEPSDSLPGTLQREMRLRRMKSFILDRLSDPDMNLASIASHFGVSTRYVSRLFSEDGQTAMEFVWRSRLARAAELVTASRVNQTQLKEVAFLLGFKTPSHFSKLFAERFGMSPSDYRKGDKA